MSTILWDKIHVSIQTTYCVFYIFRKSKWNSLFGSLCPFLYTWTFLPKKMKRLKQQTVSVIHLYTSETDLCSCQARGGHGFECSCWSLRSCSGLSLQWPFKSCFTTVKITSLVFFIRNNKTHFTVSLFSVMTCSRNIPSVHNREYKDGVTLSYCLYKITDIWLVGISRQQNFHVFVLCHCFQPIRVSVTCLLFQIDL